MNKSVLIIAAHTDDEALGCGGTIARHVAEGDDVYALFTADGVSSRPGAKDADLINRNSAAEKARRILGIRENIYLGLPDNRLDSVPLIEIVQHLETFITKVKPNIIYTHHNGDLNVDHRITHQAVLTACRPTPNSSVESIYAFEVMSSTDWSTSKSEPFLPNYFIEISDYIEKKNKALSAYQLEMRQKPHSRNIDHINLLALHRGYSVGCGETEAFILVRAIIKK